MCIRDRGGPGPAQRTVGAPPSRRAIRGPARPAGTESTATRSDPYYRRVPGLSLRQSARTTGTVTPRRVRLSEVPESDPISSSGRVPDTRCSASGHRAADRLRVSLARYCGYYSRS
eukprot:61539-Hanusia_phi.AAC.1